MSQLCGVFPMYIGGAIGCVAAADGSPATAGGALDTLWVAVSPLYGQVRDLLLRAGSTIVIASSLSLTVTVCSGLRACRSTSFMPLKVLGAFFSRGRSLGGGRRAGKGGDDDGGGDPENNSSHLMSSCHGCPAEGQ